MKKIKIALMTLLTMLFATGTVFADVADPTEPVRKVAGPVILIAIAVIVIVLIIRSRRKNK